MSVIENGTEIDTFHNEEQAFDLGGMEFSTLERFVLISYVVILITFSIASNAWVILAVIKCKPLKIIPNYYLVSLSCSDILMATLVMPLALHYNLAGVWRQGVIACKAWAFASYFCCASSIFHLCAIAIDRYRAITDPLEYGNKRTWSRLLITLAFVWGLSFIGTSPPYFGWGIKWPDHFDHSIPCTLPQSSGYAIYSSLICFYIPMTIIIGININIFLIGQTRSRKKIRRAFELVEINKVPKAKTVDESQTRPIDQSDPNHLEPIAAGSISSSITQITRLSQLEPRQLSEERSEMNQPKSKLYGEKVKPKQLVWGNKRRQILPADVAKLRQKISIIETRVPCSRCLGMIPKKQGTICQSCAAPNNLVTAAENSRLAILIQKEKRSAFIMAIIIFTFIICWVPAFTTYLVLALSPQYRKLINPKLITMVWWMAYSNSACNPIIYTMFNKDFRAAFRKFLKKIFKL